MQRLESTETRSLLPLSRRIGRGNQVPSHNPIRPCRLFQLCRRVIVSDVKTSVFTIVATVAWSLIMISGCADKLETGYVPRGLGDTESQRRAYYAAPFSPEATPADELKEGPNHRRPSANY